MDELEARPIPGTEGFALAPFFSPDGQWIGFATGAGLRKVPVGGGPPITIVEHPDIRGASWGVDGMIVFGSTTGLWRVPVDGGTAEQLTNPNADRGEFAHTQPELLASGRGVLFTVWPANLSLEDAQVAVLSLATGQITSLFRGIAPRYSQTGHLVYGRADGVLMAVPFDPVRLELTGPAILLLEGVMVKSNGEAEFGLSRNGSLVYLTGAAASGTVVMVDRFGAEQSLIEERERFSGPRFSPDGTRLALGIGQPPAGQVWIYEMAQGTLMPLTFEGNNAYPAWTCDGERVAFASDRAGLADLFWRPADGSGIAEPLLTADHLQFPASLSCDGRYLTYREIHPVTGRHIWVLPLDGDREPWAYTQTPAHSEHAPVLSPDGRWLAYVSDLSGMNEVYVNSFPDPGGRRQVSIDGGTEPVWSPDGTELFYRNGAALMAAAVETTPDFRVRSREVLFEGPYAQWVYHSNYDIHPDGERFVMIKPIEQESARLVVVLNWFEELRRRAGPGAP
jgi:serine/threonine-protein kinase